MFGKNLSSKSRKNKIFRGIFSMAKNENLEIPEINRKIKIKKHPVLTVYRY